MTTRTLYLVRHGHRLDEIDKQWYEKANGDKYDSPLSDTGKEQAQKLAQRLHQEPIDWVFTSPYYRAIQTAHPIAEALDLPLYVENGIGEWLGKSMMPQEPNILPAFQRRDEFPMLEFSHNPRVIPHYPETASQCFDRLEHAITQLLADYDGNLLIVGHGRTVTGLAHRLVGQPESTFKLNNAGITKLDYDNGKWVTRLNSDTTHLTAQTMPQFI
ncbi:MAG: histidine phosphatase family protein [Phototrophicaceae bacterium]